MTNTIQDYADNALLSNACYANLIDKKKYKEALIDNKFTELQAEDFLSKYEVFYHYPDDEAGLSFTIFKEKESGKLTLACRGTEMGLFTLNDILDADLDLAVKSNIATHQGVNLYNATIN
ncbi:MAG: hypothetical protein BWY78_00323 [Alphaproteobacteria bacterium ADurb.Bin438]|nr:MAG: hypothetical protein BWY78_00323 [Alphaproteobacteria bacterium ADurb.Bin438]